MSIRVLAIDDDPTVHDAFTKVLAPRLPDTQLLDNLTLELLGDGQEASDSTLRVDLEHASSGEKGKLLLEQALGTKAPFSVVIIDMRMPGGWDGLQTLKELLKLDSRIQVIICTAYSDHSWDKLRSGAGGHDGLLILKKPFDSIELSQMVNSLGEKYRSERAVESHVEEIETLLKEREFVLDGAGDFLYRRQLGGSMSYVSNAYERNFGLPSSNWGETFGAQVPPNKILDEATAVEVVSPTLGPRIVELRENTMGGGLIVGIGRDVSERVRLEADLRQAQKLEVVGHLAGGVAHDFNNLLTIIGGEAELLKLGDYPMEQAVDSLLDASQQAADLTKRLLMFSRGNASEERAINLSELMTQSVQLFRRLVPLEVNVVTDFKAEGLVHGSAADLSRLLMNLMVNAADAMPDGGEITVRTHDDIEGTVCLSVSDDGVGMSPEVRARLFEPFFTTKAPGQGTGLGMRVVQDVVSRLGGSIEILSAPSGGTSFQLLFPAAKHALSSRRFLSSQIRGEGKLVLIAEDEPRLLVLTSRILENAGFETVCFGDSREAAELPDEHLARIDLLLSDVVMPFMSGPDLYRALKRRRPNLNAVFMTGFADGQLTEDDVQLLPVIRKPWARESLLRTIAKSLLPQHKHLESPESKSS